MNYQQSLHVLTQVCSELHGTGLTADASIVLTNMFPTILPQALAILDQGKVIRFQCEKSSRTFFRVKEPSQQKEKDALPIYFDVLQDFCFCSYYARECLSDKGSSVMCKHVLAARLALALESQGLLESKSIEDNDFAPLLLNSKAHQQKYEQKIVQKSGK